MMISVVVPAYKQEATIEADLKNISGALSSLGLPYEIIVVVDGSPDRTFEKASSQVSDVIKVYAYKKNRGKGYALRFGAARAKGERIVFLDAGMDIDPAGIRMLLSHMDWYDADVVVGSKRHPVSQVDYPLFRRLTSFVYQMLTRVLFGLKIRDTQTGLKVFRKEVLDKVLPRLLVKDYAIDIEILSVASHLGFKRIYEAPVKIRHQFSSLAKASLTKEIFKMLKDTLAVFYRLRLRHYYDDGNERRWVFDPDLQMKVNIG